MTHAIVVTTLFTLALGFASVLGAIALFGMPAERSLQSPFLRALAARVGRLATPLDDTSMEEVERLMQQGGFQARDALERFFVLRGILAFLLPASALSFLPSQVFLLNVLVFLGLALVGYMAPRWWVEHRRAQRQSRIARAVPEMMEYMLPLLESGQSVDGVLRYLSLELDDVAPDLTSELRRSISRMDAGMTRDEALRELRERTGVEVLDSTLQVLGHAEQSGASLLDTMRTLASDVRERQLRLAEEHMASRSPYFTVITIVFAMPMLLVLIIGPAAADAYLQLSQSSATGAGP